MKEHGKHFEKRKHIMIDMDEEHEGPKGFAFGFNTQKFGKRHMMKFKGNCAEPHIFGGSHREFRGHHARQIVKDDTLHIIIHAPGVDKSTIKLRAKSDKLTFSGKLRQDLIDLVGDKEIKIKMTFNETVDSTKADAEYKDGVMLIKFPIIEEGEAINFE